jgi:hypothetical protein
MKPTRIGDRLTPYKVTKIPWRLAPAYRRVWLRWAERRGF